MWTLGGTADFSCASVIESAELWKTLLPLQAIYGLATFLDARFKDRLSEGRTCFREQGTGWIEQEAKDLIVDTDSVEHQKDVSSPLLPVEQLFSVAWNVFHYRRFNLAPRNAELLVFLNKVLSLLHYQY
uniref:Uncharacterized protein n=1 Tax=Ditylenchus dipsaci TaxID=166011 RepID=A0A915EJ19_9BILA